VPVPPPPPLPPSIVRTTTTEKLTGLAFAWALVKYVTWKAITFLGFGPIYVIVIAEGFRLLVPALGQKLHKLPIPGLAGLAQYQESRRLDLALFLAIFLLVAVWWLWEQVLKIILTTKPLYQDCGWHVDLYKRLILILGVIVLGADAALFYSAMVQIGWGGTRISIPALLATAAYLAIIVFVSLVSINLRKNFEKS
jgi:hypothetical protein